MDVALERRTLAAEDDHWWYRGRRAMVADAVRRSVPSGRGLRILDAGCGGGAVLAVVSGFGEAVGLEPSPLSRGRAAARGAGEVVDGYLERLPFADHSFDLAICLDVLEHLDDDRAGLAELRRVVRDGGSLVVTVPAHPRLWSRHDELNHHRRRYTRAGLAGAAASAGWSVARLTHFNSLLLPVALVGRRLDRSDGLEVPPRPLNRALAAILGAERRLIAAGVSFPVGLSLLAELRPGPGS
jgi:SAM-dependent methyltransferase